MVRVLAWSSAALTAAAVALLLLAPTPAEDTTTTVIAASDSAPLPAARCAPGTLEDHGVCVPVPPPAPEPDDAAEAIPLLPGRPEDLSAYRLPGMGAPELHTANALELPPHLAAAGPALLFQNAANAALDLSTLEHLGTARVLEYAPEARVLLLGYDSGDAGTPGILLLLSGVVAEPALTEGAPLPPTRELRAPQRWSLTARQLRPGRTAEISSWRNMGSVAIDPRNVLAAR